MAPRSQAGDKVIIRVHVIPNSRKGSLEALYDGSYRIKVTEKATGGRANAAVIGAVASLFRVRKSGVSIVKGFTSRDKVMEVSGANGAD